MTDHPVLSEREGAIALITLNRPQALNALNPALCEALMAELASIAADPGVRAVILTGAGRGFCSGADLADSGPRPEGMSPGEGVAHSLETRFNPLIRALHDLEKPTIAAVNGTAAGGGVGIALACDIVLAARGATFVQVFAPRLALVPDAGCTYFLPHLVGRARSRALALLGDRLPAEEAERIGLIWRCLEAEALMPEARALAARLAKGPTRAFALTKRALNAAMANSLERQLDLERDYQRVLGEGEDFREGVIAFLQKREPGFKGA